MGLLCWLFNLSRPHVLFLYLGLLVDEIWAINHRHYIQSKLVVSNGNVRTANCRENNILLRLYRPVCGQYSYGSIQKLDLVVSVRSYGDGVFFTRLRRFTRDFFSVFYLYLLKMVALRCVLITIPLMFLIVQSHR